MLLRPTTNVSDKLTMLDCNQRQRNATMKYQTQPSNANFTIYTRLYLHRCQILQLQRAAESTFKSNVAKRFLDAVIGEIPAVLLSLPFVRVYRFTTIDTQL